MAEDEKNPPQDEDKDKKDEDTASDTSQSDKADDTAQALSNVPEKFKGKSAEEIAKAYTELESKFGEHSKEVEEARAFLQQRDLLVKAVSEDPELYKKLDEALIKAQGGDTQDKKDGEAVKVDPKLVELRKVEESRIISEFEAKFGIKDLEPEKRKEMLKKVSTELAELLDPGGTKPMSQIVSEASLQRLPKYLENAYWLAHKETIMDRGNLANQDVASIGSISAASSSQKSGHDTLTEDERKTAEKLGVKPEDYLENKKKLRR